MATPLTADSTAYTADTTALTADRTQIGNGGGEEPVTPTIVSGGSGGGFYLPIRKRWHRLVNKWVDLTLREMYEETKVIPEAKVEAARIVKPYAEVRTKIPPSAKVDWSALQDDAERSRLLIELWIRYVDKDRIDDEIEREDEMIFFGFH